MLLTYTTPNGRIKIEQEITKGIDAFEFVSKVQEIFEEEECGCCHSKRIRCETRKNEDYKFFQYTCLNPECGARLEFGQHKEGGGLFAKRWDKEASRPLPDNGWFIWQPTSTRDSGGGRDDRPGNRTDLRADVGKPRESAAANSVPF